MVTILGPLSSSGVQLPFYSYRVPAGFPSPAADHLEQKVSLDELLDLRAPHMYLVRMDGVLQIDRTRCHQFLLYLALPRSTTRVLELEAMASSPLALVMLHVSIGP